jgi:regulator of sirC expression with transglutaminase-like and TPR domain
MNIKKRDHHGLFYDKQMHFISSLLWITLIKYWTYDVRDLNSICNQEVKKIKNNQPFTTNDEEFLTNLRISNLFYKSNGFSLIHRSIWESRNKEDKLFFLLPLKS